MNGYSPLFAVILAGAALSPAVAQQPPPVTVDVLISRSGDYVADFVKRFSNVVAEEQYLQEVTYPQPPGIVSGRGAVVVQSKAPQRRELKSDFLLVRTAEQADYMIFRDVFEVDGRQVRDREQRLTKLFLESSNTAVDQATRVALEGARYNLSGEGNTINNPLVALAFVQSRFKARFKFTLGKLDKDIGPAVWIVNYEDISRPTLIRGNNDRNIVARGRYWIDADTGRILKSELTVGTARILTLFRVDDSFQIAVPFAMQEWGQAKGGILTGSATYSRFRRFQVSSDEKIQQ